MEYLVVLKNGLGNKIFIMANILHRYPKNSFYVIDQQSHHQQGSQQEKFWYLFPLLKENPRIKFIQWKEYDSLKKTIPALDIRNEIYLDPSGFKPAIKKLLVPAIEYQTLEDKYDFKNGIFVHYRLGDKVQINYQRLQKGLNSRNVVMKPAFYTDNISELRKKDEPVYIFSDSPKEAKCLLKGDYVFVNEGANETFYCFWKAKRVILSDSTLTIAATLLGSKKKDLIVPGFIVAPDDYPEPFKLIPSPYFSHGDPDEKYMMKTLKDYQDLIKKCKLKV
uniref:Glycosyltransferase n=1 Tax=viral metagenome TaxID=1070528 RepID=A0A6C0HFL6_9ZZZZ